ncbi:Purine nucleoside phosphorylase [Microsporum audouinii]
MSPLQHLFLAGVSGAHPLRGPNAEEFGTRFPPLSDAYDLELRRTAHRAWKKVVPAESKRRIHEGVYAYCSGPSFETRAECRMLRMLGADTVGMSTVPEIIVARHCGMKVLALGLVTNNCVLSPAPRGDDRLLQKSTVEELNVIVDEGKANHEEVLEAGRKAASDMQVRSTTTIPLSRPNDMLANLVAQSCRNLSRRPLRICSLNDRRAQSPGVVNQAAATAMK